MRKILIVLCFVITAQIQAQVKGKAEYVIRYEVDFILDSTNRADVKNEVHRLYTGSSVSYYASEASVLSDSIYQTLGNRYRSAMLGGASSGPTSSFIPTVYKDFDKEEVWVTNSILLDHYLYQDSDIPIAWNVTEEVKEISQYTVQKATTSFGGRDFEAWFTLEVPIVDGPYVFGGLPGLIIELYDTDKDYHFNLASITPLKEPYEVEIKGQNIKVSKEEIIKAYRKYLENPGHSLTRRLPDNFRVTEADGSVVTKRDIDRQARDNAAKKNNQIEHW